MTPSEAAYFAEQEARARGGASRLGPDSNTAKALAVLDRYRSEGRQAIIFQHNFNWVIYPLIPDDNPGCS